MQDNDLEQAVELFSSVLEVRTKHYGGECLGLVRLSWREAG